MVAASVSNEILSQVAPERLWKAIVKDSPSLMPRLLPELVSSIVILEGDGGVGTIRQSNFTSGNTLYWKDVNEPGIESIHDSSGYGYLF